MKEAKKPTIKEKIFFWAVLSLLSVFFAEVLSGSQPFALIIPWNPLVLMPLYGIHTLLLARLVFKGTPTFSSLFTAGCIFGLYEAYITKVLFDPHWGASPFQYLGVDFLWILILVLWWHVFFAFIIPLLAGEVLLTRSDDIQSAMPGYLRNMLASKKGMGILLSIFIIWSALFMGSNMPAFWTAPVALGINLAVLAIAIILYRKTVGPGYKLQQLLPDGREFWILLSILLAMYMVFGFIWNTERLPGPRGHLIILGFYLFFFILLIRNIRTSKTRWIGERIETRWKVGKMLPAVLFTIFTVIALIMGLTGVGVVFILISFLLGIISGIVCLAIAIRNSIGES
jgi:hypothetical protein